MNNVLELVMSVGVFSIGVRIIQELDKEFATAAVNKKMAKVATILCLIIAVFIEGEVPLMCSMFWGPILLAAYSDYCTNYIYDFVYLPAIVAGVGAMIINREVVTAAVIVELIIFIVLQFALFKRFYGTSDCIAFSVCAVWLSAFGDGIKEYFILMTLCFMIHIIVQLCKKNIDKKGRLKKPKAMIPYIAVSILIIQFCR